MCLYKIRTMTFVVLTLLCSSCVSKSSTISKNIYVALSGYDSNQGSIDDPVKTLTKALILARTFKHQPVNIWLREGRYSLSKTIKLTKPDDRLAEFPLVISAYQTEKVSLMGAKPLPYWNKVVDSEILKRLPKTSNKQVYVTNLHEYGITNFGSAKKSGVALYYNDKKMQLARYPNKGFLTVGKLVEPNTQVVRGYKGSKTGEFHYKDNAAERWVNESDVWLHGYWFWNWKDEVQRVDKIDVYNKKITLEKPYHYYGYRKGQKYFAYNVLAELDIANEWYLERSTGHLYFYPETEIKKSNPPMLTIVDNLITLTNVSNVTFKNLTLEMSKNNGISVKNGENNLLTDLVVKNIGNVGAEIRNSKSSKIVSSELFSIGATAIVINGGDRNTLTSANICAINNRIHDYATVKKTYQSGISLGGVGNCAKNNEIYNAPHFGVFFTGNNHIIEYNDIHHVVKQSNDAGAIYAGRDWTSRGNVIRYNYLHDIQGLKGHGAKGIYLDDEMSGVYIHDNIFDNVHDAVFIGGGRDNIVDNNLFVNSNRSVYIDVRGIGWAKGQLSQLTNKLNKVPHRSSVWQKQYPKLSNVLTIAPRLPVGNVVSNNAFFDTKWNAVYKEAKPYVRFKNNHHLVGSKTTENYQINRSLAGFNNIPFNEIGIK